jgi:hypothetical protein
VDAEAMTATTQMNQLDNQTVASDLVSSASGLMVTSVKCWLHRAVLQHQIFLLAWSPPQLFLDPPSLMI